MLSVCQRSSSLVIRQRLLANSSSSSGELTFVSRLYCTKSVPSTSTDKSINKSSPNSDELNKSESKPPKFPTTFKEFGELTGIKTTYNEATERSSDSLTFRHPLRFMMNLRDPDSVKSHLSAISFIVITLGIMYAIYHIAPKHSAAIKERDLHKEYREYREYSARKELEVDLKLQAYLRETEAKKIK